LEAINAVIMGSARARQHQHRYDRQPEQVMPIIIHGDSAFTGQGIVMETLNMSQTRAYAVGGSVHLVINNQVGFTTSERQDSRTAHYCTDVVKMIDIPVFHVNADDPETAVFFAQLAIDYRMRFKKDVVLDLVCYRRLGHNEADEPAATQPLMYQNIRSRATTCALYAATQIERKHCTQAEYETMQAAYQSAMAAGESVVDTLEGGVLEERMAHWDPYLGQS
jgi:2-oxoglutarate dehydrogenase E1 component